MLKIELAYSELSKWGDSLENKDYWRYAENSKKRSYFYNLILESLKKDKELLTNTSSYLFQEINNINFVDFKEWTVLNDIFIVDKIKKHINYNKELDIFKNLDLDVIFKDSNSFKDFRCKYKKEIIEAKCKNNPNWFKDNTFRFHYKDNIYIELMENK